MLGDSLVEAQHLKELQSLEQRKLTMLQEQSLCAAAQADTLCAAASQLSAQTGQEMQRELASKCCELAEACINIHRWKKQAALQQLRLVSAQEDLGHQKVYIDALSAECSRRQELNDNLHAQLQMQHQQAAKLNSELSEASHQSGNLQVRIFVNPALFRLGRMKGGREGKGYLAMHISCVRLAFVWATVRDALQ